MKPVDVGSVYRGQVMPALSDMASAIGNKGVDVVSSPATIGYLEIACHHLIDHLFEGDEATVGVGFDLKHLSAAYVGQPVDVEAELVGNDGKRLSFKVKAAQGGRTVMSGTHVRALVHLDRFLKKDTALKPDAPDITFWFDVHSPWVYLAVHRIGDLARRHGARLTWCPFHLPRLVETIGGRRPLEENAAFVSWFRQDIEDHAEQMGLPFTFHPDFPLRNSRALRTCLYADDQGLVEPYVQRLTRAYWAEEADISDFAVLASLARDAGLDGDAAVAAAQSEDYKNRVETNTQAAIDRGIFGVPTVDTGSKLYFGQDRFDLLERHLMRDAGR